MKYYSTRARISEPLKIDLSDAIEAGLAPDGGLYVPENLPDLSEQIEAWPRGPLAETAGRVLKTFFKDDAALAPHLEAISAKALNFQVPLKFLPGDDTAILELFHGPTAAFKDVGARFLAECFTLMPIKSASLRTILVATSGDTGGAVAAAFHGKPGIEVAVLFPAEGVSPLQRQQLTCWGDNVRALAVQGSFDDCQRLVKEAFSSRIADGLLAGRHLTSANSISIGRLLPQCAYYATSSLEYRTRTGEWPGYVIPSGNAGNALAAIWAMEMGFPIREIFLATNSNRVVLDFLKSGVITPAPTVKTLANAMDVGNPSNLERMAALPGGMERLRARVNARSVNDEEIRQAIRNANERFGEILCPHTAAAYHARWTLKSPHWIVVATAHPAKFNEVIQPILGSPVPLPPQLASLMEKPSRFMEMGLDLADLRNVLE